MEAALAALQEEAAAAFRDDVEVLQQATAEAVGMARTTEGAAALAACRREFEEGTEAVVG